ncbi:DUF6434 domain-containing protein [Aquipseudomonas campi]
MKFDWHSDPITHHTVISSDYKNTQNVRRFMLEHCGPTFRFDRDFMAWIRGGAPQTMGEIVAEWQRRNPSSGPSPATA